MKSENGGRFALPFRRLLEALFAILFLVQIYLNITLHQRIRTLETALQDAHRIAISNSFSVGETIAPIPVRDLNGKEFLLNPTLGHRQMMMLIIDPDCDACQRALDDIQNAQFKNRALVIISVSEKGTKELAQKRQVSDFTYILLPNVTLSAKMKFSHTPTVLLLSLAGRITRICDRPLGCV